MNNSLQKWREGIYLHEERISCYGIETSRRMTVIKLQNGSLWIHSPNELTKGLEEELTKLGNVSCIIAPNKMHQKALDEYQDKFPDAKLYLPSSFPEMRPDLVYNEILSNTAPLEWNEEISQICLRGNVFFTEVVFYHHASKTLIVTDLIENIKKENTTKMGSVALRAMDGFDKPVPAPEHKMYTLAWKQFSDSIDEVKEWPFNAINMAHGRLIEENAHHALTEVANVLIKKAKTRMTLTKWCICILAGLQCKAYMKY